MRSTADWLSRKVFSVEVHEFGPVRPRSCLDPARESKALEVRRRAELMSDRSGELMGFSVMGKSVVNSASRICVVLGNCLTFPQIDRY